MNSQRGQLKPLKPLPAHADEQAKARYQLVELWRQLFSARGLTVERLVEESARANPAGKGISVGTVANYLGNPEQRWNDQTLDAFVRVLRPTRVQRKLIEELVEIARHGAAAAQQTTTALRVWKTAARAAKCDAWVMSEFTATAAQVHTAVGRRHALAANGAELPDLEPPVYVYRTHDDHLRRLVQTAARGDVRGLILLQGTSSTGKTRSLYEAVQTLGPGWRVLVPSGASALMRVHADREQLLDAPTVLWLNEVQRFFGPPGNGLSIRVLEDLAGARGPLVVVGTIWPSKRPPHGNDQQHESAALLDQARGQVHTVSVTSFTAAELHEAGNFASHDPRVQRALDDPDHVGFTQTLAGGGELLELYRSTENSLTRDLLDAAGDARRLGHDQVLPEQLLREMTLGLWRHRSGNRAPTDWTEALSEAVKPLRGSQGVQALIPITDQSGDGWEPKGFHLADYLEQHLRRSRVEHPVVNAEWEALATHSPSTSGATIRLAQAAAARGRVQYAERLYLEATASQDPDALFDWAAWLRERPGRAAQTEQALRTAANAGHHEALDSYAGWLAAEPGREAEAEQAWRSAIAGGAPFAIHGLTTWLEQQSRPAADIEQAWRDGAARGDFVARRGLAEWLQGQPGREADAEQAWVMTGLPRALAEFLSDRLGRELDAERAWRAAVVAGDDLYARRGYAEWLASQPGREIDAEKAWFEAIAEDPELESLNRWSYARWLAIQPDRGSDAEQAWRAAAVGDSLGARGLAEWLASQEDRYPETEQAWRDAAAQDPHAFVNLAELLLLHDRDDDELEQVWRDAVAAGDPYVGAVGMLAALLSQHDRHGEVEQVWGDAVAADDPFAASGLADWLSSRGRKGEVEQVWRDAVTAGAPYAYLSLITWLDRQPGREADAEQACRDAVVAGVEEGFVKLVGWLLEQGRVAESEGVQQVGVDDRGRSLPMSDH